MYLLIEVLKPFGYFDEHDVGEIFEMPLKDVNELVKKGYIQIVVNNVGNNVPHNEPEEDIPFYDF